MNVTDKFVQKLYQLSKMELGVDTKKLCREKLLDYVGVTLAGSVILDKIIASYPSVAQTSESGAPIIGHNLFVSMEAAALLNGMSAHAAELDDGERFGMVHPGAPVISALLAALHVYKFDTEKLLSAINVGYQATIELARGLQPHLKDNGYHATGVCGCVGAAMAIAVALDFNQAQMKSALCSATSGSSGIVKLGRDNSQLKSYNSGQAALNGLVAAMIGKSALLGPDEIFVGEHGFFQIMTGHSEVVEWTLSDELLIERVYVKPYAACRHCHAPIEAALLLRENHDFLISEISQVTVITHRFAAYKHDHVDVRNVHAAKMSIPFSVAIALVKKKAGLQEFSEDTLVDQDIRTLVNLICIESDETLTALVPHKRVAIVEIKLTNGSTFSHRVDLPIGEPEHPLSSDMLAQKFISLASYAGFSRENALELMNDVLYTSDLSTIVTKLTNPQTRKT